jgi:hypothetical protein
LTKDGEEDIPRVKDRTRLDSRGVDAEACQEKELATYIRRLEEQPKRKSHALIPVWRTWESTGVVGRSFGATQDRTSRITVSKSNMQAEKWRNVGTSSCLSLYAVHVVKRKTFSSSTEATC